MLAGFYLTGFLTIMLNVQQCPFQTSLEKGKRKDCYGDFLPGNAIARLGTIRFRHPPGPNIASTFTAVFPPDSRFLASSLEYSLIRVWETATGKEIKRLKTPNFEGFSNLLGFSPKGLLLATSADWFNEKDQKPVLLVWDLSLGKVAGTLKFKKGQEIICGKFINEKVFLVIGKDGFARWWDLSKKSFIKEWNCLFGVSKKRKEEGPFLGVIHAMVSGNEQIGALEIGWKNKNLVPEIISSLVVCDLKKEKNIFQIERNSDLCHGLFSLSGDGKRLAALKGNDWFGKKVSVWEPFTGLKILEMEKRDYCFGCALDYSGKIWLLLKQGV